MADTAGGVVFVANPKKKASCGSGLNATGLVGICIPACWGVLVVLFPLQLSRKSKLPRLKAAVALAGAGVVSACTSGTGFESADSDSRDVFKDCVEVVLVGVGDIVASITVGVMLRPEMAGGEVEEVAGVKIGEGRE